MSFHNVRFPTKIAVGATMGAAFNTTVLTTASGATRRNRNWSQPQITGDVSTGISTADDMLDVIAFHRARHGRAFAFLFKDWTDFRISRQAIGATNGATVTFQIYKRYSSGGEHQDRPIKRPVSGTVQCWVDGSAVTLGSGGSQFQVNLSTGIITLGATLAATTGKIVEIACEFDIRMRFDIDRLAVTIEDFDIHDVKSIPIVEDPED